MSRSHQIFFNTSVKTFSLSTRLFLTDAGSERGGADGAGLLEFTQRGSGGHRELPQGPEHHLPPGTLAPDPPPDGKDGLHLRGAEPPSE